jgi:hypothetical protein
MKSLQLIITLFTFSILFSCSRNDREEKNKEVVEIKDNPNSALNSTSIDTTDTNIIEDSVVNSSSLNPATKNTSKKPTIKNNNTEIKDGEIAKPLVSNKPISAEKEIDTPLKNFLKNGQIGKTYTKKELIENFKFPKEGIDLIKQVTFVAPNELYFKWGSTWLVEKVSDAKFKNGNMAFVFKGNKTYISGGAIGIKYNKKIYTELILNNGSAYIPSVKGYHWEINKQ